MQVEDVAREGFAAGWPAEQERELPVRVGLLRQVVVDDQRVLAPVEEVLRHGAPGERRDPLDRRCLSGGGVDDRRVLHRPGVAQPFHHLRHGRRLLADRDVDALHVLVVLVQDRVDRDRRLAGGTVTDDQLALAPPDVRHRVDRLDAGLQGLLHGLARDHAGRLPLDRARLGRLDRPEPVERVAERVDHASQQSRPDRDGRDVPGAAYRLAFRDQVPLAEERGADVVLLEVEREPDDAVLELEHLERDAALEAVDAGDAVTDLQHRADLGEVRLDVEVLDPLLEDRGDLFGTQLHVSSAPCALKVVAKSFEAAAHAGVEPHRAGLQDDAADQVFVDGARGLHLAP